jgi:hypothetical protein
MAEQSIRAISLVAKDIADFVVTKRMIDLGIEASRDRPGEFAEFKQSLTVVSGNLTRARESYLQSLRDLQALQANTVLAAIDRVATELEQKQAAQQAKAVVVMRAHFKELLQRRQPDMDRWADELSNVIPKVEPTAKRTPSV